MFFEDWTPAFAGATAVPSDEISATSSTSHHLGSGGSAWPCLARCPAVALRRVQGGLESAARRRSLAKRRRLALPRRCRARARDRRRSGARHPHGVVSHVRRLHGAAGGSALPDAEVGVDTRDGALARLRRRLENPPHLPWLHAAGDDWRV